MGASESDGNEWSAWKEFHVNAPIAAQPVVSGGNVSLQVGTSIPASSLFSASDAMTAYQFWDSMADGGHFVVNGAPQTPGHAIDVAASQLAQASFVAASTPATDQLWVRAFDGMLWSDWHPFTATSHA